MKIALYDIDYTIISINSLLWFFVYIFKKRPLKIVFIPYFFFVTFLWGIKVISTKKVKELWLLVIKDIPLDRLESYSRDFIYEKVIPKIKPEAVENINAYKQDGYKIIFATASFELYIKYLAEYFQVDYFFGTRAVKKDNTLFAQLEGKNCKGAAKIERIFEVIKEEDIDKMSSFSYSDSNSDLPFLIVTHKFFKVHPRSWKVLQEVKASEF